MELKMSVFNIGFVIFPQLTQLDFTGPPQVLARLPDAATHIVGEARLARTDAERGQAKI
jgi:hypothetical protein